MAWDFCTVSYNNILQNVWDCYAVLAATVQEACLKWIRRTDVEKPNQHTPSFIRELASVSFVEQKCISTRLFVLLTAVFLGYRHQPQTNKPACSIEAKKAFSVCYPEQLCFSLIGETVVADEWANKTARWQLRLSWVRDACCWSAQTHVWRIKTMEVKINVGVNVLSISLSYRPWSPPAGFVLQ